eukprot:TRINITY_DN15993_c0_g1_i9.p1 TRINITY_DN15993_c0_g1~~TRINITY_DN15993_c0_g1_i9.p1  ORF type:complete len:1479 (-),score=150.49 TRINITY_DN15993_c0_g1_i9:1161-5597(-)
MSGSACDSVRFVDDTLLSNMVSKMLEGRGETVRISIPWGDSFVDYVIKGVLSSHYGIKAAGVYALERDTHTRNDASASLPVKLALKVPKHPDHGGAEKEVDSEISCLRSASGLDGVVQLYGEAFQVPGVGNGCYKGILMELVDGVPWGNIMPLSISDECALQETAFKLMCGMTHPTRAVANLDLNNPGNWMASFDSEKKRKFVNLDLGYCFQPESSNVVYSEWTALSKIPDDATASVIMNALIDHEALSAQAKQDLDTDPSESVAKWVAMATRARKTLAMDLEEIMWKANVWPGGPWVSLSDLVLNSQSRIDHMVSSGSPSDRPAESLSNVGVVLDDSEQVVENIENDVVASDAQENDGQQETHEDIHFHSTHVFEYKIITARARASTSQDHPDASPYKQKIRYDANSPLVPADGLEPAYLDFELGSGRTELGLRLVEEEELTQWYHYFPVATGPRAGDVFEVLESYCDHAFDGPSNMYDEPFFTGTYGRLKPIYGARTWIWNREVSPEVRKQFLVKKGGANPDSDVFFYQDAVLPQDTTHTTWFSPPYNVQGPYYPALYHKSQVCRRAWMQGDGDIILSAHGAEWEAIGIQLLTFGRRTLTRAEVADAITKSWSATMSRWIPGAVDELYDPEARICSNLGSENNQEQQCNVIMFKWPDTATVPHADHIHIYTVQKTTASVPMAGASSSCTFANMSKGLVLGRTFRKVTDAVYACLCDGGSCDISLVPYDKALFSETFIAEKKRLDDKSGMTIAHLAPAKIPVHDRSLAEFVAVPERFYEGRMVLPARHFEMLRDHDGRPDEKRDNEFYACDVRFCDDIQALDKYVSFSSLAGYTSYMESWRKHWVHVPASEVIDATNLIEHEGLYSPFTVMSFNVQELYGPCERELKTGGQTLNQFGKSVHVLQTGAAKHTADYMTDDTWLRGLWEVQKVIYDDSPDAVLLQEFPLAQLHNFSIAGYKIVVVADTGDPGWRVPQSANASLRDLSNIVIAKERFIVKQTKNLRFALTGPSLAYVGEYVFGHDDGSWRWATMKAGLPRAAAGALLYDPESHRTFSVFSVHLPGGGPDDRHYDELLSARVTLLEKVVSVAEDFRADGGIFIGGDFNGPPGVEEARSTLPQHPVYKSLSPEQQDVFQNYYISGHAYLRELGFSTTEQAQKPTSRYNARVDFVYHKFPDGIAQKSFIRKYVNLDTISRGVSDHNPVITSYVVPHRLEHTARMNQLVTSSVLSDPGEVNPMLKFAYPSEQRKRFHVNTEAENDLYEASGKQSIAYELAPQMAKEMRRFLLEARFEDVKTLISLRKYKINVWDDPDNFAAYYLNFFDDLELRIHSMFNQTDPMIHNHVTSYFSYLYSGSYINNRWSVVADGGTHWWQATTDKYGERAQGMFEGNGSLRAQPSEFKCGNAYYAHANSYHHITTDQKAPQRVVTLFVRSKLDHNSHGYELFPTRKREPAMADMKRYPFDEQAFARLKDLLLNECKA